MVLDEADKMLGLGFQPQLQRLHEMVMPKQAAEPVKAAKGAKKRKAAEVEAGGRQRPQVRGRWCACELSM